MSRQRTMPGTLTSRAQSPRRHRMSTPCSLPTACGLEEVSINRAGRSCDWGDAGGRKNDLPPPRSLTRQLFSQVFEVFVAETVGSDQSTGLGVTCIELSSVSSGALVYCKGLACDPYRCSNSPRELHLSSVSVLHSGWDRATRRAFPRGGVSIPASGDHIPVDDN